MTEVLIKRLSKNIEIPKYETSGSSGMDLSAHIEKQIKIEPGKTSIIPTGISLYIMTKQLKVSGSTLRSRSPEEKGKIVNQVVEHIWPLIEQGKYKPTIFQSFNSSDKLSFTDQPDPQMSQAS